MNRWLALLLAAIVLAALFGLTSPIPQDPGYFLFSDSRAVGPVPNFWNVVSNVPYFFIGLWGIHVVRQLAAVDPAFVLARAYLVFFFGILLTAFGSSYFHWAPTNGTLFWDRLPMTIAFAGFFALVIGEFGPVSLAQRLLSAFLLVGFASVVYWQWTEARGYGDLRPYAIVQFLPMVAIPAILLISKRENDIGRYLWLMIAFYVLAKVFEHFDAGVYRATGFMSGHALKHLASAVGPALLVVALRSRLGARARTLAPQ